MAHLQYMPGDPHLVDQLVCELKSKGIFDQFRKDCIADVDTRPAYQNLRQRVETSVSTFLARQTWKPDLNKNQLREKLRKHLLDGNYLEQGVERIVDQVVNPKVASVFIPQVEDLVYNYLGIPRKKAAETSNGKVEKEDLLPTDLEAVSPGSVNDDKNEMETSDLQDTSMDVDENKCSVTNESNTTFEFDKVESQEINDLTSPNSDGSIDKSSIPLPAEEIKPEDIPPPENSPPKDHKVELDSIALPKEPNLSTDIPLPEGAPKDEKDIYFKPIDSDDDDSSSDSSLRRNMSPLTPIRNFDNDNSCDAQQGFDNDSDTKTEDKKDPSSFRFAIEAKSSENSSDAVKIEKKETEQLAYRFNDQVNINSFNTPLYDDSSNSNNLQIDYESDANSKTNIEAKLPEADYSEDLKKDRKSDDRKSSHKSSHRSRDSQKHSSSKGKRSESKHSSRDSSRHDKKSSKDERSSDKSKSSRRDRSRDRSDKKDSRDSSRHGSSHKSSSKDSNSKDSKSHRSSNSSQRHSSKTEDRKSSSQKDKERSDKSSDKSKDRSKDSRSSSHRSDKDRKSSKKSEDKDKDRKDKKETDDHYSASGRGNNGRRSTDRDSNDGSSSSKGSNNHSGSKTTESKKDKSSNSKSDSMSNSGDSTSPSDKDIVVAGNKSEVTPQSKPVRVDSHLKTPISTPPRLPFVPDITLKKPKYAANFEEAKKLMKMRKFLDEEQKRMNQEAALLLEFQANVRPSLSQVYSSIPGPELEFACVKHVDTTGIEFKYISNNSAVEQSTNEDSHEETIELIQNEIDETNVIQSIEQDTEIDEGIRAISTEECLDENQQIVIIEGAANGSYSSEDILNQLTGDNPVEEAVEDSEYVNENTVVQEAINDSDDEKVPNSVKSEETKEIVKLKAHEFHITILEEEPPGTTKIERDDNFVEEVKIENVNDKDGGDEESPFLYFAEHEKYNAELERDRFSQFFKEYSKNAVSKLHIINCSPYEENIVRQVAESFGQTEVINYFKNGHLKISNSAKNVHNLTTEITLPEPNSPEPNKSESLFSPIKAECSFELSSDYNAKLEEMVNKTSRQQIMEIILGNVTEEDSDMSMPRIDYCNESNIESQSDTENSVKRKFSEVESSVNNNRLVLTPNKIRKLSCSDQISSTTEEPEDPSSKAPNSVRSKYLGKARRVGLPRPKRPNLVNSPLSDKSVENYEQNSSIPNQTPNGKIKSAPRNKVQRYDTLDLYKPKLHYLSRRNNIT